MIIHIGGINMRKSELISKKIILIAMTALMLCTVYAKESKKNNSRIKIVAATSASPAPFTTVDKDGKVTGYDIDVLKEIFRRLPQYDFSIQITEFQSIFTGIDAGIYQVGCNHFGYNRARGEKYIFTDEYAFDPHSILVKNDNKNINSFEDIGGYTTEVGASSYNANLFETYNKQHPENPVKLIYVDDVNTYPVDIASGKIDFYFFTTIAIKTKLNNAGIKNLKLIDVTKNQLTAAGGELLSLGNFYIVSRNKPQLAADMNKAYRDALQDGTIAKISGNYFEGINVAPSLEDVIKAHSFTDGK